MVGVANGEGVRQGIVERNIVPGHIRHRSGALIAHPLVVFSPIPCAMPVSPAMREVCQELQSEVGPCRLRMERQDLAVSVGLMPHRLARGQHHRSRIAKSPHSAQAAEVMIERAVLLREDDDMFDVSDRAGAMIRGKRHGPTNALRKRRSSRDAAQNTEEIATVSCSHFDFSLAVVWGEAAMLGRHNYGRATDSL